MIGTAVERKSGYSKTLALFPKKMRLIVTDISTGVEVTPGVDSDALVGDFVGNLSHIIKHEREKYSPGGMYYEVMRTIQGRAFTDLSFKERYASVSQTAQKPEAEKQALVAETLQRLQRAYQTADLTDRRARYSYANACRYFSALHGGKGEVTGSFPAWKSQSKEYISLPTLIGSHPKMREKLHPDKATMIANNRLQTETAKAIGIFLPNETSWFDFIHRDTIKLADSSYQLTPEDKGLIIGYLKPEKGVSTGDSLVVYGKVPTKYPEVNALAALDYFYNGFVGSRARLEELMEEGFLTPRLLLRVPTDILLAAA